MGLRLDAEPTTSRNFRVIAATNRDLYADMSAGIFREGLFYRLAVLQIALPALKGASGGHTLTAEESGSFVRPSTMVEDTERSHIRRALLLAVGSVSKTAELLGISRKTLRGKPKRLAVDEGAT